MASQQVPSTEQEVARALASLGVTQKRFDDRAVVKYDSLLNASAVVVAAAGSPDPTRRAAWVVEITRDAIRNFALERDREIARAMLADDERFHGLTVEKRKEALRGRGFGPNTYKKVRPEILRLLARRLCQSDHAPEIDGQLMAYSKAVRAVLTHLHYLTYFGDSDFAANDEVGVRHYLATEDSFRDYSVVVLMEFANLIRLSDELLRVLSITDSTAQRVTLFRSRLKWSTDLAMTTPVESLLRVAHRDAGGEVFTFARAIADSAPRILREFVCTCALFSDPTSYVHHSLNRLPKVENALEREAMLLGLELPLPSHADRAPDLLFPVLSAERSGIHEAEYLQEQGATLSARFGPMIEDRSRAAVVRRLNTLGISSDML